MAASLSLISPSNFFSSSTQLKKQKNHGFFFSKPSPKTPYLSSFRDSSSFFRASAMLLETANDNRNDYDHEICRLCEKGDLKSAMDFLCTSDPTKLQLDLRTYCKMLQLCAELRSLSDGTKLHAIISSSRLEIEGSLGMKLVFMYIKCGDLTNGRRVLDGITEESIFAWNLVINEYAKIREFRESILLFKQMRESGIEANSSTFSCILKCVAALGRIEEGQQIHGYLIKSGCDSYVTVGNALIAFYSKCKYIEIAHKVFDKMLERDAISWNSMIGGYVLNDLLDNAIQTLIKMWFGGVCLDLATMVSVLPACAKTGMLMLGRILHGYAIKSGFSEELTFKNSLLNVYAKCKDLDSSVQVFSKMNNRSVVSWTSMISGYARGGKFKEAIRLFQDMKEEGVNPDLFAVTSILHACAGNGSLEDGRDIHNYANRNGLASHTFVANALMDMYAKCGSLADAKSVFDNMFGRDVISWNTMVGAYSKNSLPNEALALFSQMQLEEVKPNSVTVACILPACASLSALERGKEIHGCILRNGFFSDLFVANALVDMYVKCGALVLAHFLFNQIPMKDLISWTIMIAGYGMHGRGKDAILVFKEMQEMGVEPDEVSFIAILYACSHSGLVDEGWRFFNIMKHECKIEPKLKHYACMVDLLARAGHLIKAYRFIESMPIEPDSTVWGALLCGCRTHRDVKLAEKVAERVFELEPENTGYYVLLANIYTEAKKWEAVKKLRERMGRQRLRKNPGCSWIEIKSKVHVFVSGDRSHQQANKIMSFLETARVRMKEEGYISKKRYALIDVDDVRKEEALCGHSERLAIAFGILNLPSRKPVRVTKNLRVCGDCHEVVKFMSKMVGREIILRDSNRFHHFADGRCSCRGYW